jgi:hypothetical protein
MIRKLRNYKEEYQRRVARGLAKGLSRSKSRGHPKVSELEKQASQIVDRYSKLERGLKLIKEGKSQKAAAKTVGVSIERLRIFLHSNTQAKRVGSKWKIQDNRSDAFRIGSLGRIVIVSLTMDEGSKVGLYWNVVNKYLDSNDTAHLRNLKATSVTDIYGKVHQFELRPRRLNRLDGVDELKFQEIYADVAR